jgi:serine/threonine-protein kinase
MTLAVLLGVACALTACSGGDDEGLPDVVGQDRQEAVAALEELELTVTVEEQPSAERQGSVIAQTPAAGEPFPDDDKVSITVASAPVSTEDLPVGDAKVPDVVGLLRPAAEALLQEKGIPLGAVTPQQSTLPDGTVVSQDPAAGQPVPAGGVSLIVAESATVPVPTLLGLTEAEATAETQRVGLQIGTVDTALEGSGAVGRVVQQSPDPGFVAPRGAPIRIVVKQPGVRVPSVIGQTITAASPTLVSSGLSFDTQWVNDATKPRGTIVRLEPPADTLVPRGSSVKLTAARRFVIFPGKVKATDHLVSDALKLKMKVKQKP